MKGGSESSLMNFYVLRVKRAPCTERRRGRRCRLYAGTCVYR
jgi:hypothetical protein